MKQQTFADKFHHNQKRAFLTKLVQVTIKSLRACLDKLVRITYSINLNHNHFKCVWVSIYENNFFPKKVLFKNRQIQ